MSTAVVLGTAHPHIFALADSAKHVEGMKLIGVYDDDPARRAAAATKMEVPELTLEAALAHKPSIALIGAVPSERAGLAEQALAVGAAVLVDKPLAVTQAALDSLRKAASKHQRQVIVYYPYRGDSLVLAAKTALDAGRIGKLVRVFACGPHKLNPTTRPDWHWSREHNGGILIDIGSHHVDFCCWIADQAPSELSAMHANFDQPRHTGFQDFGQIQMRFPGGELAHVEVDWLNPTTMQSFGDTRFWIQGTKGKIELRLGDEKSAHIWDRTVAGEPLKPIPSDMEQWTRRLIADLAAGREAAVSQESVWLTSQVTLTAFDSASAGGKLVKVSVG